MAALRKTKIIGEIPIINRLEGTEEEGQVVGTGIVEELPSGDQIVHMNLQGKTADILRRGFSLGHVSLYHTEE
ncbi:hypothetical protein SEA_OLYMPICHELADO_69 [Streptomyces phage OlympicHelado]|uniref:Uncharacterized protein n=2 Tax=Rimavirus rima TaxID=2560784 RepID=A0A8F3E7L0_9CAUD|nr:hypothetical protein SEA_OLYMPICHELADO_69 [Streptomyces phage OlympicHelado]QWY81467.1 hypothetical protein PET_TAIDAONE_69 [Streptomyces phage TaidaOne]